MESCTRSDLLLGASYGFNKVAQGLIGEGCKDLSLATTEQKGSYRASP